MQKFFVLFSLCLPLIITSNLYANTLPPNATPQSIPVSSIKNFDSNPSIVKELIITALSLTTKKLTYLYGSANPKMGGMDCSGTIYYLLNSLGVKKVPRQSDQQYDWVSQQGHLYKVNTTDLNSSQFNNLKPGDLLFWSGTYAIKRTSPVTHVMLYVGKNQQGHPIMFGASNGRSYNGRSIWGVSIFDFTLPDANSPSHFLGYGCIPTLTCGIE